MWYSMLKSMMEAAIAAGEDGEEVVNDIIAAVRDFAQEQSGRGQEELDALAELLKTGVKPRLSPIAPSATGEITLSM